MTRNRTLAVVGLYLAGAAAAIILTLLASQVPAQMPFAAAIRISGSLAAVAVALGFAGAAWRRTDEAAREAHRSASFWGVPFGLLAAIVALIFAAMSSMSREAYRTDMLALLHAHMPQQPVVLMLCGALIAAVTGFAGYFLVWVGWWISHSGQASRSMN